MIKRLLSIFRAGLLGLCGLSMLTGCGRDAPMARLTDSPSLVVAVRVSPISFNPESDERLMPFEHALLVRLAERLKKPLTIIPLRSAREVIDYVAAGKAHLGAAWLPPVDDTRVAASAPFHHDELVLVQQDPSVTLESVDELSGKTIHLPLGSISSQTLNQLRQDRIPSLTVIERPDGSGVGLLRSVAEHEIEFTAAPGELASIAQSYFPEMQIGTALGEPLPVVWISANRPDNDVLPVVNEFLSAITADGSLARLKDAHFSFRRLTQLDSMRFIENINALLPQFHGLFKQAQIRTDIDWRLIAALAYQESQWNPNATSATNVRGMMMLTEETADRLGVGNRLNARESILAGADYLLSLRDELPANIGEPDRTWMALAAYNLGMGHLRGARTLAPRYKLNPDNWLELKKMLPMLARPEVYSRLKSGRARGGEAVVLVENVRAYYDILCRHAPGYSALPAADVDAKPTTAGQAPGLKLPAKKTQAAGISTAPRM